MRASKEEWLNIFDMLSDSVSQSNKCLNEYLEEFISINTTKEITGKQNRIKSNVSFVEKLVRNDYLNKWDYITGEDEINKKTLSRNLPDFIGYRINTLFFNKEEQLAENLIEFLNQKSNIEIPADQLSPHNQQANGHPIMKFQGLIQSSDNPELKFGFEIQIKSSIHNLWGEVEHGSIYKPNNFDFRIEQKKKNVEEIWNTLTSCDRQLYLLKKEIYKKDDLLKQLLTIYFKQANLVEDLNSHYFYSIFFNVFIRKNIIVMEELLIQLMSNQTIEIKSNYTYTNLQTSNVYEDLNEILSVILHKDEIESIKKIFDFCFNNITDTNFLDLLIFSIIENSGLNLEEETEDEGFDVDDEEEENNTDYKPLLLTFLETNGFKTKRIN
ncbi:hypothetical protein [Streptococcus sp. HMSC070B10]|uniref:hypothetical protein n=1 Tax=Streptococcus sp. HMSC070B10 TaxID=1715092 RepID=UPI0008A5721C|nr:hypothetical protein [Streptococcus sp. HMSC070B10]OFN99041.1 hypothetical protein HMPREF2613_10335 [Streptococcus sp. HMSC070B10]